ncbi:MAG TPA: ATPase [Novosphingobium sp.]|nr:ATPase [Novosphingobium sp.]
MAGETRIIAFGAAEQETQAAERENPLAAREPDAFAEGEQAAEHVPWVEAEVDAAGAPSPWPARLIAIAAVLCALAWTGFFAWARLPEVGTRPSPARIADLVTGWAGPVLLVAIGWLLVMRNSSREANRFGRAARALADESALLETRLVTVNRELSLAREFLAAQSRDLETLGRLAGERLSENAERLQDLIRSNDTRIETISSVSAVALDNMEKLRGQLPVLASSAKDVANNIANAGRAAHAQLEDMVNGFRRINEFGQACDHQVKDLRRRIDESLAGLAEQSERIGESADRRFAQLDTRSAELRSGLEQREAEALAAMHGRAAVLAEEIERTRGALVHEEEQVLISLRARLSSVRDEGGTVARALRDAEERAQERWNAGLDLIARKQNGLFEGIAQASDKAVDAAKSRLELVAIEAARLEAEVAEHSERLSLDTETRRREIEQRESEAMDRLSLVIAQVDADIEARLAAHNRHAQSLQQKAGAITTELAHYDAKLGAIAADAGEAETRISESLAVLSTRLADARQTLGHAEADLSQLTDGSVRLLELIHASSDEARAGLPLAVEQTERRLGEVDARLRQMHATLGEAGSAGDNLGRRVEDTAGGLRAILTDIEQLQTLIADRGASHAETLDGVHDALHLIEQQNARVSEKARTELVDAIDQLRAASEGAVATISERGAANVSEIARKLGEESAAAIDKAMRTRAAEAAGQLELAAAHAAGVSREAALQLRDQLAMVNDLVANLEQRVIQARERAEDQVDNDFSRRVALITESLNSNAIDIAKALSTDVSDTAWAAYLRGDRGIFTRRAVSLLDMSEVKAIQQVFERDDAFREHVSRYIHDFEAILRQVLSTRDGNVLGVTLLSSDMGKLYVSLAQAIERLRN